MRATATLAERRRSDLMASPRLATPAIAVVGATGAVGAELLRCLEKRRFPLSGLRLLASARSAGSAVPFAGVPFPVEALGAGEASSGPMAGAIANAVANASGARVRSMPLTPAKIAAALG